MSKKPELTLVPTAAASLAPPATLGKAGATLWTSIQSEYKVSDAGGREMLLQICTAADRADAFAAEIASDGPMIRTKHVFKEHPLLKHELAARSFIVRALHRLGLEIEPTRNSPGRPRVCIASEVTNGDNRTTQAHLAQSARPVQAA